ncbi:MAG: hypothetical protein A3I44_06020 [Candidatus Sungbacteria bacterium RIFCSPLOWO2_02_FULL_51_17]|uniref:Uncharacterized protein n=1 Tax=Candidatus Sungbacteria bacterium RIFCSPHIGHO2_02_FULL_51_29 TaxID=1802273 RepID=A0A1G2KR29_9BACT|nr:MAG: hypothetical protein A2676_01545 [Candidatus Sungbacteria bacterium RIFCSPHIGHO2_01_FULL_51_22]OHA01888.1 MAG: hypothetical protein A3C16_03280 [Candidatus Sungbacteria bacterium RIFCSPHIGHO2_02_FULL_51_29]OHA07507.1 MAG: hypothetical protein A3B29_02335 [Candidatus Sungbacteria bacterium RIFCSPLOWO2_01_FULL_51_34]OHA12406.1 MAG: hypothetical protein A3I44_06020 [Candidatus Sungbacteria bacterium RIFCSPLOWO2_02_FULL_51_17]
MMRFRVVPTLLIASVMLGGCVGEPPSAQKKAVERSYTRDNYVPRNDVEGKNYNKRQQRADDPTAIIWCTTAFPIPSSPIFTVPVVGKLTSGNKRPYPTSQHVANVNYYSPELPGNDAMYGSSGEYRYGFTPADVYVDYYGMPTFCTDEPTVWQRESTVIVMERDPALLEAHKRAREALAKNDPAVADKILSDAIGKLRK